jgi:two-component system phosphate regulon sensor histidine kinase PhoR
MLLRVFSFLLSQGLGAWLGYVLTPGDAPSIRGVLVGMLVTGAIWGLYDFMRGLRVLQWLRDDALTTSPPRSVAGPLGKLWAGWGLNWGLWGQVTDRVRRAARTRERAARESERRLQNILLALQASPNGLVLIDASGRIDWFNHTASEHLGLDPERDLQQHLVNLVRNPAFTTYMAAGDYSSSVTMPGRGPAPKLGIGGSVVNPMRLSVQLHEYGGGRRLLLTRDITLLEQAEAMRRDFVANVSHEIRTPLTVLGGFVETLQTLPLDETERAKYLTLMAQQADRMQALVSDLLMLSRLEGSPPPGEGEWTALPALMGQLQQEGLTLSAVLHPAPTQTLTFESAPALEIAGASGELHSALSNLVSNAIRYTPAGGAVRCGWRKLDAQPGKAGERWEFYVQDSGPGIAKEHIPRLTERFYRVDRSRSRETGGTGLGLAIVKHVAQRHGAELKIESAQGVGSRFALLFPASRLRENDSKGLLPH